MESLLASTGAPPLVVTPAADGYVLVRVSFTKEQAVKTVVASWSHTVQQIAETAIKKVLTALPVDQKARFRERYTHWELYDEERTLGPKEIFLSAIKFRLGDEVPSVSIRKGQKQPDTIVDCFRLMVRRNLR
jgi:hypothetical protein